MSRKRKPLTPEQIAKKREAQKRYTAANRDKRKKIDRAYRARNKERIAASMREYRERNKEKIAAHMREYREAHKAEISASNARWAANNIEKVRAKKLRYYYRRKSIQKVHASPETVMREVYRALPPNLPRAIRDDVAGSLILAILDGKALLANVRHEAMLHLRQFNRQFDTWKTVSLDAPMPGTDTPWIEMLAAPQEFRP